MFNTILKWFMPIRLYGGSGGGTQTQVHELPAWRNLTQNLLTSGMNAINRPVQEYKACAWRRRTWTSRQRLDGRGRALGGSPVETAARQQNYATQEGNSAPTAQSELRRRRSTPMRRAWVAAMPPALLRSWIPLRRAGARSDLRDTNKRSGRTSRISATRSARWRISINSGAREWVRKIGRKSG